MVYPSLWEEEPDRQLLQAATVTNSWTMGLKKVLFIRADFPDVPGDPSGVDRWGYVTNLTSTRALDLITNGASPILWEFSYGKTYLSGTVTPIFRMSHNASYYATNGYAWTMVSEAQQAAEAGGFFDGQF